MFAEFMGYWPDADDPNVCHFGGDDPDGPCREWPDPENNDTDCMALVRALRDAGNSISVMFGSEGDVVLINQRTMRVRDDYKQGVCDLAEPIVADLRQKNDE
jgi:hypothetical protein